MSAVTDDRAALIRLLDLLERSPRPKGWHARFRHSAEIRHAHWMLQWDEAREEGPACLRPMRNQFAWGFTLMCLWTMGSALVFGEHALTLARVVRAVVLSVVPIALSVWFAFWFPRRVWVRNEREYTVQLQRARALLAETGGHGPEAHLLFPAR